MSKDGKVSVSVIMPAYNSSRYIEKAIRSVMAQTYAAWQLLVVDDASSDDTCSIVEALVAEDKRIFLLKNEANIGVARSRNRALDMCVGRYVAFLDSDDLWLPEKLEKQIAMLERCHADIVYTSYSIVNEEDIKVRSDYIVPETVEFGRLLRENVIGCSTVLLSEKIVQKYRFKQDFYHEDYVLWLDLLKDGYRAVGCSEPLVKWRFIDDSRSFDKKKSANNRWKIYRNYLKYSVIKSTILIFAYAIAGMKKYS